MSSSDRITADTLEAYCAATGMDRARACIALGVDERETPATTAQRETLQSWGAWADGMTFSEANMAVVTCARIMGAVRDERVAFTIVYR